MNTPPKHLAEKYQHIPFVYLDVPKIVPRDVDGKQTSGQASACQ
jgi:hypothetical protein